MCQWRGEKRYDEIKWSSPWWYLQLRVWLCLFFLICLTLFQREKDNLYIHSEHINILYVHLQASHSEERQTGGKNRLTCLHNWNGFSWDYDERNGNTYYCFFHQYLHHLARVAFLSTAANGMRDHLNCKTQVNNVHKKMENKTRKGAACEDVQAEMLHPVKLSWHSPKWRNEHELLMLQLLFHSDIPFNSSEMSLCFQD